MQIRLIRIPKQKKSLYGICELKMLILINNLRNKTKMHGRESKFNSILFLCVGIRNHNIWFTIKANLHSSTLPSEPHTLRITIIIHTSNFNPTEYLKLHIESYSYSLAVPFLCFSAEKLLLNLQKQDTALND